MSEQDSRWPQKGMKAFAPSGDWKRDADLDWGKPHVEYYYIDGFKEAGDAVVDAALATGHHTDKFLYPAAFLYRHFIELFLKELHVVASELINSKAEKPAGHFLLPLWQTLRPLIEASSPGQETDTLDFVESVIREFHEVDESGQEFRYSVTRLRDKTIKESLDKAPRKIDLGNLKATMNRMDGFFNGCIDYMGDRLKQKHAYESQMEGETGY
ncbi:MAG: hypothetical protein HPKKFMNG_02032 [Planctomycetes bacterium]|nr:hypothetical protein [Planctomycetota bacterium]